MPGRFGAGDIGPKAFQWINFIASTGCELWQVLPLGPTGYGDSPYQCFSAFAGNPLLVSPDSLLSEDLLHPDDIVEIMNFPDEKVDFGSVIPYKLGILDRSYHHFKTKTSEDILKDFETFSKTEAYVRKTKNNC